MVTTIQLNESTKDSLSKLRSSPRETYEDVILNLIKLSEIQKRKRKELLIRECKENYEENMRLAKEAEGTLMDGLDPSERWDDLL